MEKKFDLYDEDPSNEGAKPHGVAFFMAGENTTGASEQCREADLIVVRTIHANGTEDEELPIIYVGHGLLYEGKQFGEQWRSPCRGFELHGVANYQFDNYFLEATIARGKTAYVYPGKGNVQGDTWLKAR